MNVRAQAIVKPRTRAEPGTGFLYGWLLLVLFIEYARPASVLTFLDFPFFYSIPPLSLLVVTFFAPGLRSMQEIFSDKIAKWVPIIFLSVALSWAVTGFSSHGSSTFEMLLGYVFLFILIARIVTTETRLRGVVVTLVVAHLYLLAMNLNVLTDPTQRQKLVGGTFLGDGNDYSLSLCILIPLMVDLALNARSRFRQLLSWASVVVIILAIIATQSRGGTIGIASVMIYLWWRSQNKVITAVAIAIVGALIMLYAPSQYFQRMGTVTGMTIDGSAQGRLDAWSGAIGMGAKNPVFGIGAGEFGARWGKTAHSTYMLAFAELGLPGLVCVLMLVFGNIWSNMRIRRAILSKCAAVADAEAWRTLRLLDLMNASMISYAVTGAFLSTTYYPHMYVLTALLISARIFANRAAGIHSATGFTNTRMFPNAGPPARTQRNQM